MAKSNIGVNHHKLIFPTTQTELPCIKDEALNFLRRMAAEAAIRLACTQEPFKADHLRDERQIIEMMAEGNELLTRLFIAFLYFQIQAILFQQKFSGSIIGANPIVFPNAADISATSGQELCRICLEITPEAYWDLVSWETRNQRLWYGHLTAAFKTALAAKMLTNEGAEVYLPTVREDTRQKIDLVATFKNRAEGLCIQIKSDMRLHNRIIVDTRPDTLRNQKNVDEFHELIRGTRKFQASTRGVYHPMYLQIGHTRMNPKISMNINHIDPAMQVALHNALCDKLDEHAYYTPP